MIQQLYSIRDCADILTIEEHRICYAHRTGKLTEPTYFVAGKRIYSKADLRKVANYFGVDVPDKEQCGGNQDE